LSYHTKMVTDIRDRESGDGEYLAKRLNSGNLKSFDRSNSKSRSRVPPEGREKVSSPSRKQSTKAKNLGCGDINCNDAFCKTQLGRYEFSIPYPGLSVKKLFQEKFQNNSTFSFYTGMI